MKKLKYLAFATALALSISLMGCGTVATENNVPESTESLVAETETVNATEETVVTETVMLEENLSTFTSTANVLLESIGYDASFAESYGYTFAEMYEFMIPVSTVNIRSLPSTDGAVICSLNTSDIVTANGYCNETGWYRIVLSRTTSDEEGVPAVVTYGYVSSNYLKTLFGDEPYIHNSTNSSNNSSTNTYKNSSLEDGFRKDIAQEIWNLVNAERTANGIPALAWDDTVYEFSCQRAQALVNDFSHNGSKKGSDGENILMNWTTDANTLHMQWHNSSGHYGNYMYDGYERGACAVYVYNGNVYAVENFKVPDDVWTVYKYEHRYELVPTWTASNGVILRIEGPQSITTYDGDNPRATEEMIQAAVLEYYGVDNSSSSLTETSEPTYEIIDSAQTEPDTWTASNGVTVYVMNGNAYTINDGYSEDDHLNAWLEYSQSH